MSIYAVVDFSVTNKAAVVLCFRGHICKTSIRYYYVGIKLLVHGQSHLQLYKMVHTDLSLNSSTTGYSATFQILSALSLYSPKFLTYVVGVQWNS